MSTATTRTTCFPASVLNDLATAMVDRAGQIQREPHGMGSALARACLNTAAELRYLADNGVEVDVPTD